MTDLVASSSRTRGVTSRYDSGYPAVANSVEDMTIPAPGPRRPALAHDELGITTGTVKSHAARGRDRLREVLVAVDRPHT